MTAGLYFHVPSFRIEPLPRPELRRDPITERWVIISTDRLGRPNEIVADNETQSPANCPFCAGNERLTPPPTYVEPPTGPWRVRVVPNTFPAVRGDGTFAPPTTGWEIAGAASGVHEILVPCGQHERSMACLPVEHFAATLRAFRERMRVISRQRPELYTQVFSNYKAAAGASMEHAHSHLIALPIVPETVRRELAASEQYFRQNRRCIFCDLIERERREGKRIVFETERFVVLAPFASRFPCETWLLPRKHGSHFERLMDDDLTELAEVFRRVLRQLYVGLADPPCNFLIHTAPAASPDLAEYHWHIETFPRLTGIAGFECGTGMNINPVPPEQAAPYLRGIEAS